MGSRKPIVLGIEFDLDNKRVNIREDMIKEITDLIAGFVAKAETNVAGHRDDLTGWGDHCGVWRRPQWSRRRDNGIKVERCLDKSGRCLNSRFKLAARGKVCRLNQTKMA